MKTEDTHELVTNDILDAIEKHTDKQPHVVAHALISIGAQLARDAAPTPEECEKLINLALEAEGLSFILKRKYRI